MYALPTVTLFAFPVWPPENLTIHASLAVFVWRCWDWMSHWRVVVRRTVRGAERPPVGDRRGFIQDINCLLEDLALAFARGRHEGACFVTLQDARAAN